MNRGKTWRIVMWNRNCKRNVLTIDYHSATMRMSCGIHMSHKFPRKIAAGKQMLRALWFEFLREKVRKTELPSNYSWGFFWCMCGPLKKQKNGGRKSVRGSVDLPVQGQTLLLSYRFIRLPLASYWLAPRRSCANRSVGWSRFSYSRGPLLGVGVCWRGGRSPRAHSGRTFGGGRIRQGHLGSRCRYRGCLVVDPRRCWVALSRRCQPLCAAVRWKGPWPVTPNPSPWLRRLEHQGGCLAPLPRRRCLCVLRRRRLEAFWPRKFRGIRRRVLYWPKSKYFEVLFKFIIYLCLTISLDIQRLALCEDKSRVYICLPCVGSWIVSGEIWQKFWLV